RTPDVWFPRYRGAESTMTESCCSLASSVPGPESRTEAARLAPIPAEAALRRPDLRRGVSVAADHGQEADSEETDHEDQPHQPDGNADVAHDQAGDRLSMTVFAGSLDLAQPDVAEDDGQDRGDPQEHRDDAEHDSDDRHHRQQPADEPTADSDDAHPHRPHGHFVGDGADDHRWRAVGHRLTVDARLPVGTIGTRLAVRPRLPVRVLLVVGVRLAVRSRLPVRVIGSWLAVPALAVSLVSLRVRLPLGVGLSLRVLPGAVLRLRPIVVVELLRADLRWITRTVFGVVGHVRHRFRSDTVCTPPP